MVKNKSYKLGRCIGYIVVTVVLACLLAIIVALTINIVRSLLF